MAARNDVYERRRQADQRAKCRTREADPFHPVLRCRGEVRERVVTPAAGGYW
ncbi:hypothetical protein ACF07Y_18260 [Streptomyces sp. NPDC016566]|uniref:hypothetical protein n=1 Tax=unclassified Streptomyces TaxID=2593676 RepID=UPI001645FF92|nr:hypothetical protein [Streptomyces sp. BK340]